MKDRNIAQKLRALVDEHVVLNQQMADNMASVTHNLLETFAPTGCPEKNVSHSPDRVVECSDVYIDVGKITYAIGLEDGSSTEMYCTGGKNDVCHECNVRASGASIMQNT